MSTPQGYDSRTIKGKKSAITPPTLANPGRSGPTTFFLRSESDMQTSTQRGRKMSRASTAAFSEVRVETPSASRVEDSTFGVESLDTINSASSGNSLSRTNSASTEPGMDASMEGGVMNARKRKAGNPVHPKIAATGQRLFSAEHPSTQASSAASPVSFRASESPFRSHLRRGSAASSINLNSQPLTPLKMSPHPESGMPSTPRSGSPKSFRLSDEENSIVDETGSQAIQSSSGDEDEDAITDDAKDSSMPQLVMPSIAVPARRPFTERGKRMGRLKVMVVGPDGSGKTSLIRSICRVCEDIVHVDSGVTGSLPSLPRRGFEYERTTGINELYASTRPYPTWWTDFEGRRQLLRRKSIGDGVLERNVCFVDTPGLDDEEKTLQVLNYFNGTLQRTTSLEKMADSEIINMLSGEGGNQIDVTLWLFDAAADSKTSAQAGGVQKQLLETVCQCTNVIPVLARADNVPEESLEISRQHVTRLVEELGLDTYAFPDADGRIMKQPPLFAISTALGEDVEIDASVLMSSQYVQPLVPSDLDSLVEQLLEPENIAHMRHVSATKFLLWRQQNLGLHLDLRKQTLLQSPQFGRTLRSQTSTGSLLDEPSKVLVPHGSSSYYRSASPSLSEASVPAGGQVTSSHALAHYNEQTQGTVPFRQVRLAKWAQDLQRSLDNERKRYKQMYLNRPSGWSSENGASDFDNEKALTTTGPRADRPARGRLGGDIAIIDPLDPLGLLAFSHALRRRSWFALQFAGGCGLIGAVAWWVMRNWAEVQEWCGVGGQQATALGSLPAMAPPSAGVVGYLDDLNWRGFFGWDR